MNGTEAMRDWLERVHEDHQANTPDKDKAAWDKIHRISMDLFDKNWLTKP